MGSRALWLLSLPLVVGGWLAGHVLMHAVATPTMAASANHGGFGTAHACAVCLMTVLLVLLLLRPAVVLGYEVVQRLAVGLAPRPSACTSAPWRFKWVAPDLARPPILATCHGGRAPPRLALVQA